MTPRMISVVFMVTLVFSLAGVSPVSADEDRTTPSETSLGKIQKDYKAGKLTPDDYVVYRVWAIFQPYKLVKTPYARHPGEGSLYIRLASVTLKEARAKWDKLGQKAKRELSFILYRPTDQGGGIDSAQRILPKLYETARFVIQRK